MNFGFMINLKDLSQPTFPDSIYNTNDVILFVDDFYLNFYKLE